MRKLKAKLRSNRGASITFALLLFMVCAVASTVVIVSASTSSGRLSQLAQMDQRYYAVTSAAELICGAFNGADGKPVTVTVDYTVDDESGTASGFTIPDADDDYALLNYTSEKVLAAIESGTDNENTLSLTATTNTTLNCKIVETVMSNGLVQFDISNVPTATNKGVYTLQVVLSSCIQRFEPDEDGNAQATVSWKVNSIRKVTSVNKNKTSS